MAEANVKKCGNVACKNTFQDEIYGAGMRLYNPTTKGSRCSNCGTTVVESGGKK